MMNWLPVALGALVLAGVGLWWVFVHVVRSSGELSTALQRVAGGDYRPVILTGKSILFGKQAANLRAIAEILARQKTVLAQEEFSISMILGSMTEGIVITGADLRIRLVNKAAEEMFSLRGAVTGLSLAEVLRSHELQAMALQSSTTGALQRGEITIGNSGRSDPRHLMVMVAALGTPGGETSGGLLLVLHDVTRLRELESVRREFVANVSHEFRTPLSVINGYLETLEEDGLSQEMVRKSIAVMRRHGDRLNRLIEDLLTISRMEEKGVRLEKQPADPGPILLSVVQQMEREIAQRGVEVRLEIPPGLPSVDVDAYQIEQVFSNLLGNAIRYGATKDGGSVLISTSMEGGEMRISFRDEGPGIPLQDQEHLFERFYRVGGDRARQTGGTGLGLSIVKNIVTAHGGRVTVESRPGEGSRFSVFLPGLGS
jgi:two-component system, OmpR family, phosphate regulon sensor histidine kinase PhoR